MTPHNWPIRRFVTFTARSYDHREFVRICRPESGPEPNGSLAPGRAYVPWR